MSNTELLINFKLTGQCPSGKNAQMIDPRSWRKYPNKRFVEWRNQSVKQMLDQKVPKLLINEPCSIAIHYWPGDKRTRDVPGIIDALWHLLEYYEVVENDKFLGASENEVLFFTHEVLKTDPHLIIRIYK